MYDRAAFAREFDVPRETLEKLDRYAALLSDWQSRINLVGSSTLPEIWSRHFRDSAQLLPIGLEEGVQPPWLDIGSGAGFPGLVLAILGAGPVHLVEARRKKCDFLAAAADELELEDRIIIHNDRLEALPPFAAGVITARACAPLHQLFNWGLRFAALSTRWLLLKGGGVSAELASARKGFDYNVRLVQSRSDPRGKIAIVSDVKRKARQ